MLKGTGNIEIPKKFLLKRTKIRLLWKWKYYGGLYYTGKNVIKI